MAFSFPFLSFVFEIEMERKRESLLSVKCDLSECEREKNEQAKEKKK